ncbi:Transcriptional regulatory protein ZraR [Alienimonas californiensis]|uniref:Transcriptional regulatory protein ZraR n=1 Tax=Alienimonas californiensis TaxID=2527989 RepID=A0A517PEA7_9PLAN|nr:Transcriptional regulatory protein ZraR [Alienimonas californiensis]
MTVPTFSGRYVALTIGTLALLAAIGSIAYVAVSPDLRLRIVLADDPASEGATLIATDGLKVWGEPGADEPRPGDLLRAIGDREILSPVDFYDACDPLYRKSPDQFADANENDPIRRFQMQADHPFVQDNAKRQYVRVLYSRPSEDKPGDPPRMAYVRVQGVPVGRMGLLIGWLLLQIGLTVVGGMASWLRPFDRAARLFFLMSATTVVAVSGVSLWWALAHSTAALLPLTISAALLPSVTLHFFLSYPRALPVLRDHGFAVRLALYLPAGIAAAVMAGVAVLAARLAEDDSPATNAVKERLLDAMGWAANGVMGLALAGFVLTLAALWAHWRRATLRVERGQLRLILAAAVCSVPAAAFLLYLAVWDRPGFLHVLGFLPVLWVSLLFAAAYTGGMVRYRLLRVNEVLRGGTRLLLARSALALAAGAFVAVAARVDRVMDVPLSPTGSTLVRAGAAVLAGSAAFALFHVLRERLDRIFYREKYRLDRVLRSFGGGENASRQAAADVVAACREVVGCEQAAVYLPDSEGDGLIRAAATTDSFPERLSPEELAPDVLADGEEAAHGPAPGPGPVRSPEVRAATGAETLVPLPVEEGAEGASAGWILLGPKEDRTALSAEDLTFLEALSRTAAAALREGRVRRELESLRTRVRRRDERRERLERRVASLEAELAGTLGGAAEAPTVDGFDRGGLRGDGPAMRRALTTAAKAARCDVTVLLRGESGTGKELLARAIHANGRRAAGPLVAVHCAALSPALLESELFGHVKGAFTGADRDRPGRFEQADGGTLFLDEIGEVPAETQVKLLRALQERTFERVGGDKPISVDVRVIAATHRDLNAMIAAGTFREDLFYRLNVLPIELPPLRTRKEDLLDLADSFLHEAARKQDRAVTRIHPDAEAVLLRHLWPGNVRELRNTMERAVVLAESDTVTLADLPAELAPLRDPDAEVPSPAPPRPRTPPAAERMPFEATPAPPAAPAERTPAPPERPASVSREEAEKRRLVSALEACEGNKSRAARRLGLPRSTFYSRLQKHGVVP